MDDQPRRPIFVPPVLPGGEIAEDETAPDDIGPRDIRPRDIRPRDFGRELGRNLGRNDARLGDIGRGDIDRADIRGDVRGDVQPGDTPLLEPDDRPIDDEPPGFYQPPPPARPRWRDALNRRRLFWLVVLALIVLLVVWYVLHRERPAATGRFVNSGPTPVGTATVRQGDMPVVDNALGTVTPLATVTVMTQINGQLTQVAFQEGQMVKQGDFLAQIDPRPYQVALEQAQGQLAKDQAALADAELDLARYTKLVAQNSLASQTLDTQRATVAQDRATLVTDQAQIDAQNLNLVYCHITAPVSGRVGLRQVDPGNYVTTGTTTGIVVITQLQPISVIFTLPEDSLQAVLDQVNAGKTLQALAYDRSDSTLLETGQLATIDNQIDTTTGTVKLRATFPNANLNLFPNQFVNIRLQVSTLQNTELVPSAAVQRGAPGTFVYVVKPDSTVAVQTVALGPDDGTNVAITQGLQPGQVVVTDGADRLKEGAKVEVVPPSAQTPAQPGQPSQPSQASPPSSQAPGAPEQPSQQTGPGSPQTPHTHTHGQNHRSPGG